MVHALGSTNALTAAARGLASGQQRLTDAAVRTVRAEEVDAQAIVDGKMAELEIRASAKVARTADELMGTLIDDLA